MSFVQLLFIMLALLINYNVSAFSLSFKNDKKSNIVLAELDKHRNILNNEAQEIIASPQKSFIEKVSSFLKRFFQAVFVLAAVVLIGVLLNKYYLQLQATKSRLKTLEKNMNRFFHDYEYFKKIQNDYHRKHQEDINQLRFKAYKSDNDVYNQRIQKSEDVKSNTVKNSEGTNTNKLLKKFYMPPPGSNSYFKTQNQAYKIDIDKHTYEFTLFEGSENEAKFQLINNEIVYEKALNTPSIYLESACDAKNFYSNSHKTILTIKPGVVEKDIDKWRITQKTVIRYE